jgi:hypothetical protein
MLSITETIHRCNRLKQTATTVPAQEIPLTLPITVNTPRNVLTDVDTIRLNADRPPYDA